MSVLEREIAHTLSRVRSHDWLWADGNAMDLKRAGLSAVESKIVPGWIHTAHRDMSVGEMQKWVAPGLYHPRSRASSAINMRRKMPRSAYVIVRYTIT